MVWQLRSLFWQTMPEMRDFRDPSLSETTCRAAFEGATRMERVAFARALQHLASSSGEGSEFRKILTTTFIRQMEQSPVAQAILRDPTAPAKVRARVQDALNSLTDSAVAQRATDTGDARVFRDDRGSDEQALSRLRRLVARLATAYSLLSPTAERQMRSTIVAAIWELYLAADHFTRESREEHGGNRRLYKETSAYWIAGVLSTLLRQQAGNLEFLFPVALGNEQLRALSLWLHDNVPHLLNAENRQSLDAMRRDEPTERATLQEMLQQRHPGPMKFSKFVNPQAPRGGYNVGTSSQPSSQAATQSLADLRSFRLLQDAERAVGAAASSTVPSPSAEQRLAASHRVINRVFATQDPVRRAQLLAQYQQSLAPRNLAQEPQAAPKVIPRAAVAPKVAKRARSKQAQQQAAMALNWSKVLGNLP